MAWFKVDDRLWSHPKFIAAGNSAAGLWLRAGSYSAFYGSDGGVPMAALGLLGGRVRDAEKLVEVGLWDRADDGYQFHDWTEFQPTAAEVQAKRAARAEAGRKGGLKSGETRRQANAEADAEAIASPVGSSKNEANANPVPVPVPVPQKTSSSIGGARSKRDIALPASWRPTGEHQKRAAESGLDLAKEVIKFRTHAEEKGRLAKNWNAAFTRWLINAVEYAERDGRTRRQDEPISPWDRQYVRGPQ